MSYIGLIRFGYWLMVFFITTYIISDAKIGEKVGVVLGHGVIIIAVICVIDVIRSIYINHDFDTSLLTKNTYGLIFSTFTPFLFMLVFTSGCLRRIIYLLFMIAALTIIVFNGSRTSFITAMVGLIIFALLGNKRRSKIISTS